MSNDFGKRACADLPLAYDHYAARHKRKKQPKPDRAVDKALAWMAYYAAVFCAMVAYSPDVAMAAVCAVPPGVC